MTTLPAEIDLARSYSQPWKRPRVRALTPCLRAPYVLLVFVLLAGPAAAANASSDAGEVEATRAQMQSLDEQVQEIKSDVLGIAAELSQLEERLLFPSNTQVAVFVSLQGAEGFRLDSVELRVDGELVAHHIYSFKELEALRKGGVQRVYTGNVPSGEHQLEVTVAGKLGGNDTRVTESFGFRKEVEPKLVELTLSADSGDARIRLGDS